MVHDGHVEAARLERRPVQVAVAHRRPRELSLTEGRTGELQHVVIDIEADALLGVRREQPRVILPLPVPMSSRRPIGPSPTSMSSSARSTAASPT